MKIIIETPEEFLDFNSEIDGFRLFVEKDLFELHAFSGGHFGIGLKNTHTGVGVVIGGDSAFEPDYNRDMVLARFAEWSGELEYYEHQLVAKF